MDIKVPNLSEGVTAGNVVSILVKVGDKVQKDQTILELETDKAVAPIPSSAAGTVTAIAVKEGDKISVGQTICSVQEEGGAPASGGDQAQQAAPQAQAQQPSQPRAQQNFQQAPVAPMPVFNTGGGDAAASPTVRKMARELGIDLNRVRGSEAGGRISVHDLRDYIQGIQQLAFQSAGTAPVAAIAPAVKPPKESIDFSKWGPVKKQAMTSLRKTIGRRMLESWNEIPHITQFDDADMTELMELRKKMMKAAGKDVKLTVTAFIIKALVKALKAHPLFNASLDENSGEIIFKEYYHLGIAVDTEAGLIVPVLRDVDKKDILTISKELDALAKKTRDRKVGVEDLKGGTFTISNLGGIGGTYFTPIINQPETAILALGKSAMKPVVVDSKNTIEARMILPVGVSYDHRVIDGADAARFIRAVVEAIEGIKEKDVK